MTIGIDGANPWRASVERFQPPPGRAYAAADGASPWQALVARAAERQVALAAPAMESAAKPFVANLAAPDPWRATVTRAGADPVLAGIGPAPQQPFAAKPWQAFVTRATEADASAPASAGAQEPTDPAFDIERWRPKVEPTFSRPQDPGAAPAPREPDDPDRIETAKKESGKDGEKAPTTLFASEDGPTFADFLDIINPLQHIPIISSIYRELTGDRISPAARVIGDGLIFGPIGVAVAVANVIVSEISGRDVGEHMIAMVKDGFGDAPATAIADADAAKPKTPATDPAVGEKVLAEILPPGAVAIGGTHVDFASAAIRPAAFSNALPTPATPTTSADAYNALLARPPRPAATATPTRAPAIATAPTPATPAMPQAAEAPKPQATEPAAAQPIAARALAPDPMNQLPAKRTPGQVAGTSTVGANQTAPAGGWFSDVMLQALSKYEAQQKRNVAGAQDNAPTLNVVN